MDLLLNTCKKKWNPYILWTHFAIYTEDKAQFWIQIWLPIGNFHLNSKVSSQLGRYSHHYIHRYKLCPSKNFNIEKCWDSVVFALIFMNLAMLQIFSMSQTFSMFFWNIEKVWNIEKCWNLCFYYIKFQKIKAKMTESQLFSMCFQKFM